MTLSASRAGPASRVEAPAEGARRTGFPFDLLVIPVIACLALAGYLAVYMHYLDVRAYPIVRSDGAGYYAYLPALVLEKDPTFATFEREFVHGDAGSFFWIYRLPATKNSWADQYPIGEAEMIFPFFAAGHKIAHLLGQTANGYSLAEQGASGLAGLVYLVIGLTALRAVLRRFFTPGVTAATLVVVTFGTNLFHYATFDSMFSHAFSFSLVAGFLWAALRWSDRPSVRRAGLIGFLAGLIVIVRATNVVILLPAAAIALAVLRQRGWLPGLGRQVLAAAAAAAVPVLPQLLVWRVGTGHWLLNSYYLDPNYNAARFDFRHPHLLGVLWSFDPHGLLPWSPAIALALVGLLLFVRGAPVLGWSIAAVFVAQLYLIASWGYWGYGGGFGHRGFIDIYALLALPLGALLAQWRFRWARPLLVAAPALFCLVTINLMLHYWLLEIPFGGVSAAGYVRLLTTFRPW